jgi:hypothetical protein
VPLSEMAVTSTLPPQQPGMDPVTTTSPQPPPVLLSPLLSLRTSVDEEDREPSLATQAYLEQPRGAWYVPERDRGGRGAHGSPPEGVRRGTLLHPHLMPYGASGPCCCHSLG